MNLDGYAVGGLAVGESHEEMYHILDVTVPHLPLEKPTYLMGVGTPANILEAVDRGVDFSTVYTRARTAVTDMYTPTRERETCSMPNMNWISVRSKKDVSVRPAEITAAAISVIC